MNAQEDELYKLACKVWDDVGQVIVGKSSAVVFATTRSRALLQIDHPQAHQAAHVVLSLLGSGVFQAAELKLAELAASIGRIETSVLTVEQPVAAPERPPAATVFDPEKIPPDELSQLAFGTDEG